MTNTTNIETQIKTQNEGGTWDWRSDVLDARQREELEIAESYTRSHDAVDGHDLRVILARLAKALDNLRIEATDWHDRAE